MSTLTRRGFLGRLAAVAAGAVAVAMSKPERPKLTINRLPSVRYVQNYHITGGMPQRLDVLYGVGVLSPSHAMRILA
jgi:hypothetical protein